MNDLDIAIKSALDADNAPGVGVGALASGGWHQLDAPEGTQGPYGIFQEASRFPIYAFGNTPVANHGFYLLRGFAYDGAVSGAVTAGLIADRLEALMTNPGMPQTETTTITEVVPDTLTAGNASAIVTADGMTGSPKTVSVSLATNDTERQAAEKIRTALTADVNVSAFFTVSGDGVLVILTRKAAAANDVTMNLRVQDDTCVGLNTVNSVNTTPGAIVLPVTGRTLLSCRFDRAYPPMRERDEINQGWLYSRGILAEIWVTNG